MKGSCMFCQSGGPTAVINASAYGAIKTALNAPEITRVLCAAHGITGVLNDVIYDMGQEDPSELELLLYTPSSEFGSCRHKLKNPEDDESEYEIILNTFKKYDVRYFLYNGGNDSMDTCAKIERYMHKIGYECRVIGIPKTIDNDLAGTDHCPGFGSAAKYIATSFMEIYKDAIVYDTGAVTVVEVMGRHAGWLVGSAALASHFGYGPDLIYFPEKPFDIDAFITKVTDIYKKKNKVLIAVSEGVRDKDGVFISEYGKRGIANRDSFGHVQLGGLAVYLANVVHTQTKAKVRGIELSLLQRCAAHLASKTDIDEAFMAGEAAVEAAVSGESGKMVAFRREYVDGKYVCRTGFVPLDTSANVESCVPPEWILPDDSGITQEFLDYLLPLIQGEPDRKLENSLPRFAELKKLRA